MQDRWMPGSRPDRQGMAIKVVLLTSLWLTVCSPLVWAQPFVMHDLRVNGRVITVMAADLNQNRRQDLLVISKVGTFPEKKRWASVFWQQAGGHFPTHPDLTWEMDPEAMVIDVGLLSADSDHKALIYLTGSEVRAYVLKNGTPPSASTLLTVPTFAVFPEPGDLPAWPLLRDWKMTGHTWLGVPQLGQLTFYPLGPNGFARTGETVSLHQPTRIFAGEPDQRLIRDYSLLLFFRFPQLFVQDFNGDGRADLIAAWEDNVAVYLQDAQGRFPLQPSQTFHVQAVSELEKGRRTTFVSPMMADLDGDGRADLVLTKMTGRFTDRHLVTTVFLNRKDGLPARPDARIEHEGFGTTLLVKDVNGNGKRDLVFPLVRIGIRNIIRNLLSNRVDVSLLAHLYQERRGYNSEPDWARSFPYEIDMSDGIRLDGAWPNISGDFNGDGEADLLVAGSGEVAVYLATPGAFFAREPAVRLPMKTSPQMMVRDLRENGYADIIMWYEGDPEWHGVVRVLVNSENGWGAH